MRRPYRPDRSTPRGPAPYRSYRHRGAGVPPSAAPPSAGSSRSSTPLPGRPPRHGMHSPPRVERESSHHEEPPRVIYGRHSVLEAIKAHAPIEKIYVEKGSLHSHWLGPIVGQARADGIVFVEAERQRLFGLANSVHHQGVVALLSTQLYAGADELLQRAWQKHQDPFLVMLDSVQDPQNFGAILRTVDACGAHGVIIPKRRSVGFTPGASRASAGADHHVPVARIANLLSTVEMLRQKQGVRRSQKGLTVVGVEANGEIPYYKGDLTGPVLIILGGEDEGIGKPLRDACDVVVRIPMKGKIGSLNVSVAAALVLYEVLRQREGEMEGRRSSRSGEDPPQEAQRFPVSGDPASAGSPESQDSEVACGLLQEPTEAPREGFSAGQPGEVADEESREAPG